MTQANKPPESAENARRAPQDAIHDSWMITREMIARSQKQATAAMEAANAAAREVMEAAHEHARIVLAQLMPVPVAPDRAQDEEEEPDTAASNSTSTKSTLKQGLTVIAGSLEAADKLIASTTSEALATLVKNEDAMNAEPDATDTEPTGASSTAQGSDAKQPRTPGD